MSSQVSGPLWASQEAGEPQGWGSLAGSLLQRVGCMLSGDPFAFVFHFFLCTADSLSAEQNLLPCTWLRTRRGYGAGRKNSDRRQVPSPASSVLLLRWYVRMPMLNQKASP